MTPASPRHRTQVTPKASAPRHPSLSPPTRVCTPTADQDSAPMGQEEALGCGNLPRFGTGTAWSYPVLNILCSLPPQGL